MNLAGLRDKGPRITGMKFSFSSSSHQALQKVYITTVMDGKAVSFD